MHIKIIWGKELIYKLGTGYLLDQNTHCLLHPESIKEELYLAKI